MTLHLERKGKGKRVLMLHGLMADHRQVEPLLAALEDCEVFMPDLLGCGMSDKEPVEGVVQRTVEELQELCSHYGIDTVIAFSISGMIAIQLQLRRTVLIGTFCTSPLAEGALRPLQGREKRIEEFLRKHEGQAQRFIASMQREPVPGVKEASVPCAIEYLRAAIDDYSSLARKLKHVLVIHGTQDPLISSKLGMQLASCAGAQYVAVPEGHFSVLKNRTVHQAISVFVRASQRAR